jgi:hypothetical protein
MMTAGGPAGEDLCGRSTSARAPSLPLLLDVHAWWAYGRPPRAGSDRSAAP